MKHLLTVVLCGVRLSALLVAVVIAAPAVAAAEPSVEKRSLTIEQRVAAAKAIEEVYWRHRIWPESNPAPKPALTEVMSASVLRQKAEDALLASAALERYWSRPITGEQLQAEIERISAHSQDAAMLREILAALNDDPKLIAECLARPLLARRLLRHWYANDARFHSDVRQRAQEDLLLFGATPQALPLMRGEYREIAWVKDSQGALPSVARTGAIAIAAAEWDSERARLAQTLGFAGGTDTFASDAFVVGKTGSLQETPEQISIAAVLESGSETLRIGTMSWAKRSFDSWWAETRKTLDASSVDLPSYPYGLPTRPADASTEAVGSCDFDDWKPMGGVPTGRSQHLAVWTGTEMIVWGGGVRSGGRYSPATDSWTPMNERGAPAPRYGATAVWTGNEAIFWGGFLSSAVNDGGRYDPVTDTWTSVSLVDAPTPRRDHTAIWTGSEMIVWGGSGTLYSGGRFNPSTNSWSPTSTGLGGRSLHTAVWTGSEMIVWGGSRDCGANCSEETYSDIGIYNPVSDSWSFKESLSRRQDHTAIWTGREVIVWGGRVTRRPQYGGYNFVGEAGGPIGESYRPDLGTVTPISVQGSPGTTFVHSAIWTGSQMIVWGGSHDSNSPNSYSVSGGRYDPQSNMWVPTGTFGAPSPRSQHTAIWTGHEMIVWGGAGTNTGGRYSPGSDAWLPTSTDGPGGGRRNHSLVWTGAEVVGWGGYFGNSASTGFVYTPSLDSYEPTSTAAAPDARYNHTTVWTGSHMVVWGGENGSRLQTGGRFSPSENTWLSTTLVSAPSPRSLHTAVWSGTNMIVWGGNGDQDLKTGGLYYPANDSWLPTSTVGAPTPRSNHTAVWAGDSMIVWGGDLYGSTGGVFRPALNSWSPTNQVGAPSPRRSHSAVSTGTEMIIWGGTNGASSLGDGGRYVYSTSAWTPMSLVNAPSQRTRHSAVWTGKTMLLWGGNDAGQQLGSGAKYFPTTDTWQSTSETHAPGARSDHRAIWTNDKMVVWGGYTLGPFSEDPYLNIGRQYCACGTSDLTCDGQDQDCNGLFDDGFVGGATTCGVGACLSSGAISCFAGVETNTCVPLQAAPDDSLCNLIDDDCDASTDEDFASQVTNCGVGACARTGATACTAGAVTDSCVPGTAAATDATCNGIDEDCSGLADEDFASQATSCGVGACARSGATSCLDGALADSCLPGAPAANDATCNGIDEDCNGLADEDFVPQATSCGIGACAQTGSTSCTGGVTGDSCVPGTPQPNDATCNGIDEDCSGLADEDFVSQTTNCGVGACLRSGSTSCTAGTVSNSCVPGTPAPTDATCNGIDEDCSGVADDDFQPTPISCGIGACTRTGSTQCVNGQFRTDCTPGAPAPNDATCNGIDDDCDGSIDEDGACLNSFLDSDGDGFGNPASGLVECCGPGPGRVSNNLDCDDSNAAVWSVPGEALQLQASGTTFTWVAPLSTGGAVGSLRYDTLRSANPADFGAVAVCVESSGNDTVSVDTFVPAPQSLAAYLVRARNACASGVGTLGRTSAGLERSGRGCP